MELSDRPAQQTETSAFELVTSASGTTVTSDLSPETTQLSDPSPGHAARFRPGPQPRIDRSSTVYILNGLQVNLTIVSKDDVWGVWDVSTGRAPPNSVPAGQLSSEILLRDSWGPVGSEGWMTYRIGNSRQIIGMRFASPTIANNWAGWFRPQQSDEITSAVLFPLQFNENGPLTVQFAVGPPGSRIRPRIPRHLGFSGNQLLDGGGSNDVIEEIVVTDIPVEGVDDEAFSEHPRAA